MRINSAVSILLIVMIPLSLPPEIQGATLQVPADFTTIQSAIDSATHGDEIIVSPGTYIETIHFQGKNIRLASTNPRDWAVVEATIIDASQMGSVVTFAGIETEECVLAGFTIRHSRGEQGGGISGRGTHATVRNNLVVDNTVHIDFYVEDGRGGGIDDCDGLVVGNRILNNVANKGGGIAHCDGTVVANTLSGNRAVDYIVYKSYVLGIGGGAFACHGEIKENTITLNSAGQGGGLASCDGHILGNFVSENSVEGEKGRGGGFYSCNSLVANNWIVSNTAEKGLGGGLDHCSGTIQGNLISRNLGTRGGGANDCDGWILENRFIENQTHLVQVGSGLSHGTRGASGGGISDCDALIERNLFQGNRAVGGTYRDILGNCRSTGGYGGAVYRGDGTLRNNLFIQNQCITAHCDQPGSFDPPESMGGAVLRFNGSIENNTFVDNHSPEQGGALAHTPGTIQNNIFWLNSATEDAQIHNSSLPDHCLIQGWTGGGIGNIDLDPRFVDPENGNFHLRHDSPCIDSGVLIASVTDDYDGNPRPFMWSTQHGGDGSGYDLGAYEFYPGSDVNYDQVVDELDLMVIQSDWGAVSGVGETIYPPSGMATDMDGNGEVDVHDLLELLEGMR